MTRERIERTFCAFTRPLALCAVVLAGTAALIGACAPHGVETPAPSSRGGIAPPSAPTPSTKSPEAPRGAAEGAALAPIPADFEVRYLANEGFLLEAGGRRVLIDGLFGAGIGGYPAVPPELRAQLEAGTGAWGGIEVALASHFHGDHFAAGAVARFLESNPQAVFVSTPQAIQRLGAHLTAEDAVAGTNRIRLLARVRSVLPVEGSTRRLEFDGIEIEIFNLHHGRREPPVENLGLIVSVEGIRFLHLGDTEAKLETFEPYLEKLRGVDVALLPFWFLSSEWRAEMVRDRIRPGSIVVAHLPEPDAPTSHFGRWNDYDDLVRSLGAAFPEARIPTAAGERIRFDGG